MAIRARKAKKAKTTKGKVKTKVRKEKRAERPKPKKVSRPVISETSAKKKPKKKVAVETMKPPITKAKGKKVKSDVDLDDLVFSVNKGEKLQLRIYVSEFKGKHYLNFREFYKDKSGEFKHGSKGVAIDLAKSVKVSSRLKKLIAAGEEAGLQMRSTPV